MLAHVAGSVSTDLNVWERMANPCVSQADCHSATTASVVWLLALDFIFTLCVSPCPGILILDVVQTRSFLDWSHTGAFDFSRLCLYQHWSWGQGGSSLNLIQALESIVILETHECTSSVRPRNHSSAAMVMNSLANLSWMEVNMVNFACSHNAGRAPRLSGWKKIFTWGWDPCIMVSSLSAAPAISLSVGSSTKTLPPQAQHQSQHL